MDIKMFHFQIAVVLALAFVNKRACICYLQVFVARGRLYQRSPRWPKTACQVSVRGEDVIHIFTLSHLVFTLIRLLAHVH